LLSLHSGPNLAALVIRSDQTAGAELSFAAADALTKINAEPDVRSTNFKADKPLRP
jgi:hypothetical protein